MSINSTSPLKVTPQKPRTLSAEDAAFRATARARIPGSTLRGEASPDLSRELRALLEWNSRYSTREPAFLRRYGWDGCEPGTLQESGDLLGVTRERMRQLQDQFELELRQRTPACPTLSRALQCVADSAPFDAESVGQILVDNRLSSRPISAGGLLTAAKLLSIAIPYAVESLTEGSRPFVVVMPAGSKVSFQEARRCLLRANRTIGPVTVTDVARRLPMPIRHEMDPDVLGRLLSAMPGVMVNTDLEGNVWY